ncbi:hypothetical protein LJC63_09775, partial [Ruminococcaceae bacterium OttesenSCG-928-L11]|nr:hypothetical protein [Ruminococcaceae bacterium OttesenSCG-928-L11]
MLLPIIMLSLCAIGGATFLLFQKFRKNRTAAAEDAAARAAHEFVNVRDIQGNLLYTQDGKALCYARVSPISVDLYSKREQQALSRSLTAEMSGNQDEFQFLAVSRPVDISPLLTELSGL